MSWLFTAAHAATIALGTINVVPAPPGPQNTITLTDASGAGETNYPFQFGRPFIEGAIPHAPQVLINGVPAASQADVKNRYPDGSAEFAVVSVVISIPASGSVTLSFQDTRAASTPLTLSQMETMLPIGAATMTLTETSGTVAGSADAGQMLADGNCQPWTQGQVAQTMMCADDSAARKYDIGFGDGYHPFRPRFYATFWPATNQVFIRAVGENDLTTEHEDIAYKLAITSNGTSIYTKDLTGSTLINGKPLIQWTEGRWTRTFWLGTPPPQQVNIDNNLAYLESTRFIPNFDLAYKDAPATIATAYSYYTAAAPHDIYSSGSYPFQWVTSMGTAGNSAHIGPFPEVTTWWLYTNDWRMRQIALTQTDLAAAWPLGLRESDPTRRFQRSDAVGSGTGLGRALSAAARPLIGSGSTVDNLITVGPVVTGGNLVWAADTQHQPSVYFPAYVLTGDPWYLDMMYSWAGFSVFINAPSITYDCQRQIPTCSVYRGPTGAYGGLYGYDAARDQAWTIRGRAETAFAAPDGTPEKSYFTYMMNDAIAKWEGGLGITGTAFDNSTEKTWVEGTYQPYVWTNNGGPTSGGIPPLGNMAALCNSLNICSYSAGTQSSWGLLPGANGSFDDPWMNYYLEYGVGRAVELGFQMQDIQAELGKLPIGIIASSYPWELGAYTMGVEKLGGGFWPDWETYYVNGADPTYLASLKTNWVAGENGGRQTWVQPGLAMLVDQNVPGAASAWAWYKANGYSLAVADPRWDIVPRTDNNVLPAQPTATP